MVAPADRPRLRLSPELVAHLVQLEKRGELDAFLQRMKVKLDARRARRQLVAEMSAMLAVPFRELEDIFRAAVTEVSHVG